MITYLKKINIILYPITIIFLLIANFRLFQHRWVNYFTVSVPVKDEVGFYDSFVFFLNNGFYKSVVLGSSIMFNLTNRLLYIFNDNILMCLRLNSLLSLISLILLWFFFIRTYIKLNNKQTILVLLFLFHIGFRSMAYFTACNDGLFIFLISLSFYFLYTSINATSVLFNKFVLSAVFYAFAFMTRELAIYYLPGFFLIMFMALLFYKYKLYNILIWSGIVLVFVLIFNYPSIKDKNSLSFHNKDFKNVNVTWAEMNYLSLLENKDKLLRGRITKGEYKIKAEDVIEYKKINGENSLPKTYFQGLFWDYEITTKNFIGLIYLSQLPFMPQLGLFYLSFFAVFFYFFRKNKIFKKSDFIPFVFFISYTLFFCITPIRHIEFRHFMFFTIFVFVFSLVNLRKLNMFNKSYFDLFLYLNLLFISSLSIMLWKVF